ncbi:MULTISPECIES: MCP four helix bundle domain-containing protein [unclassified Colwellia]|uniref:sensor histidine kinase n=1 Tax=unclassified Colwellia TaxID=196834 RepID=UPI0015F3B2EE|nr:MULTISPECIES: MCP four helix bundle domain-containing protein [unclassified Colwellia]MBA6354967.1 MCP four helix bundle domain-containing protein [Colwellia sp. BRX8-3]MBA6366869.1 MCP four helix bundle domain-containing protein [Colwellia sp. BRX8-5]
MIELFRNMKISQKIPLSISVFIILPLIISLIAINSTNTINKNGQDIYDNYFVSFVNLTDARKYLYEEFVLIKSHILSPDDKSMRDTEQKISNASVNFRASLTKFEQTLDSGEETKLLYKFKTQLTTFELLTERIITLSKSNQDIAADRLANEEYGVLFNDMQLNMAGMLETNIDGAQALYNSNHQHHQTTRSLIILVTAIIIAIGLFIGWLLISTILEPLLKIQCHIASLTHSGDLLLQLDIEGKDEISELAESFNTMLESLFHAHNKLIQTEKLTSLGSLVAGVSHEINTPLGIAVTIGSTIKDNFQKFSIRFKEKKVKRSDLESFEIEVNECLDILLNSLDRAVVLIQSFKQVAVDQTSEARRIFFLSDVVDEVIRIHHHKIKRLGITFDCVIDKNIEMDSFPGPLGQVMTNLFNNAIIHGFESTDSGIIAISAYLNNSVVIIKVEDNGKGIPKAFIDKVFEPFFTTRLGEGGSGLGLSIIFNIVVNLLGGKIRVASTLGKNTCFTLELPLVSPQKITKINDKD